jgi:hypothetical protein
MGNPADLHIAADPVAPHTESLVETTANVLKLDPETITVVHLTRGNLHSIDQAQLMGNPAGLHIAAGLVAPHTENPVETMANGIKLDPETITVVHLTRGNLHSIGQAQRMGNPADLHIAAGPVAPHAESPVETTANGLTLGPVEITVADQADLHNAQDQVDNTANHRTLGPVGIIAVEAVLHSTQDPVARDAANTDQSAGNFLESFKYPIRKLASRRAFFCWRSYYLGTTRPSYGIKSHAPLKPTRIRDLGRL